MNDFKISIITVVYNAETTIRQCIKSVLNQNYSHIEYILIDGGSTDGTLQAIAEFKDKIDFFISEPDKGIYDAINKGITHATGNVVGTLNADDYLVGSNIITHVANAFLDNNIDILYGDLEFIDPQGKLFRKWIAGPYKKGVYNWGWMSPHPTFYCKRELFETLGNYSLNFGTAGDYELMSRFMHMHELHIYYLDKVMVKAKIGGVSNKNLVNRVKALYNDYRAMQKNDIKLPALAVILKPLRKTGQFFNL